MINEPQHTITKVGPRKGCKLDISFADGFEATVDLSQLVKRVRALHALKDPETFALAHAADHGGFVIWIEDELELAADNLRNLAVEQAGGIGPERMIEWMHRNKLKQQEAASAIGISRRMLNYYISGAKPIPKTVWLACLGFEFERNTSQLVPMDSGRNQEELATAMNTFGQQLAALSEKFVEDYGPLTERLREDVKHGSR